MTSSVEVLGANISGSIRFKFHPIAPLAMAPILFTKLWADSFEVPDHPAGAGRGGILCPDTLLEKAG